MRREVNVPSDLIHSFGNLIQIMGSWWKKKCYLFWVIILTRFLCPVQPESTKQATCMIVKPFADCSGHIVKDGDV